ncbi:MAG TPA: energy transducer TonB [Blastocatellia bacterium]|nr:energy transducer TonB [Blastocatellia bacterium]
MNSILRITHPVFLAILLTSTALDAEFTISTGKMSWQLPPGQITAGSDPREVLTNAWAAIGTVKSFRYRIEFLPDLLDRITVIEYVSPDRYHTTLKNRETIVIGNDFYEKMGDKPWRKLAPTSNGNDDAIVLKRPKQNRGESMKTARDIKLIGADKIDGVESLLYEYDNYDASRNTLFMKMKVWVAVADGFVRRAEGQVQGGARNVTIVYNYYDYNADIKIEPPELLAGQPAPETGQVDPPSRPSRYAMVPPGIPTVIPSPYPPGTGGGNLIIDGSAKSVVSKPVLLNRVAPVYTDKARENGVQGIVRLRVLVGEDGLVKQVVVISGLPDGLTEAAVKAAQQLKFRPATKDGKPTAFWLSGVTIEFNIRK